MNSNLMQARKPDGGLAEWIACFEAMGGENDAELLCLLLELRRFRLNANHIPDAGKMIIPDNVPCAGSPDFIWLQVGCDSGEPNVWPERAWDNVTWNNDRIHNDDVLYVSASLIGKPAPGGTQ